MNLTTTALLLAAVHLIFGVVFLNVRITDRYLRFFVAFSAGTLLAVSLSHLLPEAAEILEERTGLPVLVGFFVLWAVEHLVGSHDHTDEVHDLSHDHGHHHHDADEMTGLSILASIVLILHGLIDGMALSTVSGDAGWDSALLLGLSSHAPALMLALVTLLRLGGLKTARAMAVIAVACAVIPLGALVGVTSIEIQFHEWVPVFQAFIAGSLIYLATHHLLPAVEHGKADRLAIYAAAMAGAITTLAIAGFHEHGH